MSEVSLKEHFDRLLGEFDRRIDQAYQSATEARTRAETAMDKRLDLLNEFRAQSADESAKYARLDQLAVLTERIKALESSRDRAYGGIGIVALIGIANLVKLFFG